MKIFRLLTIAIVVLGLAGIPALAQTAPRGTEGVDWTQDTTPPRVNPYAPLGDIYEEDFCDVAILEFYVPPTQPEPWVFINNSTSPGGTWFQGPTSAFNSHMGDPTCWMAGNWSSTNDDPGIDNISLWALTGEYDLTNVCEMSFWTRTLTGNTYADHMVVRLSENGDSTDVGATWDAVGDFTTVLHDINPTLVVCGDDPDNCYPEEWTNYTATGPWTGTGRFAFHYLTPDGGWSGTNSNYIGIDTLNLQSCGGDGGGDGGGGDDGGNVPATTTWGVIVLIALFLGITLFYLRRRSSAGA